MISKMIQKAVQFLHGRNSTQTEMDYLLSHGLQVGKNFQSYSPYAIDANWPWLITIGDNVLLSSNVKIGIVKICAVEKSPKSEKKR